MATDSSKIPNGPLWRYALAVVVVPVSILLRNAMIQSLGRELPPFIVLYPAVMIVAVLAGFWPGLLATGLAVLGTLNPVLQPRGNLSVSNASDVVSLAFFSAMGILMSLLAERYRRSQRSIAAYKVQLALRRHQAEIRESSEFRQLALDAAGLGTWEFLPETGAVSVDGNCRRLFGFQPEETDTHGVIAERIHPQDQSRVGDAIKNAIAGVDGGLWGLEYRVVWPDGSIHWLTSHGRAYFT